MNFNRRKILSGILAFHAGSLLPFYSSALAGEKASNKSCHFEQETLNIIQDLYGYTVPEKTDLINFDILDGFSVEIPEGLFLVHPSRTWFTITYDPTILHTPISIIIEKHNRYHGGYYGSELVATYKTNGNVSSIGLSADIMQKKSGAHGGEVNIFAVAKSQESVMYACLKAFYPSGEDGCC